METIQDFLCAILKNVIFAFDFLDTFLKMLDNIIEAAINAICCSFKRNASNTAVSSPSIVPSNTYTVILQNPILVVALPLLVSVALSKSAVVLVVQDAAR